MRWIKERISPMGSLWSKCDQIWYQGEERRQKNEGMKERWDGIGYHI